MNTTLFEEYLESSTKTETSRYSILVVDDDRDINSIIQILNEDFNVKLMTGGQEAINHIFEYGDALDCVVMDAKMPIMDGFQTTKKIREKYKRLPIILHTAYHGEYSIQQVMDYEYNFYDYVVKGENLQKFKNKIKKGAETYSLFKENLAYKKELLQINKKLHEKYIELDEANETLSMQKDTYKQVLEQSLCVLSKAQEYRDPYTAGHQQRVAQIAVKIAKKLGYDDYHIQGIQYSGLLHDIGKIAIYKEILIWPDKLDNEEFNIIKRHPQKGYELLQNNKFPWPIAEIVYQHHEKLDGSGYPRGLCGDEILKEAKIISVADVVEAMSSHRPYRGAKGIEAALDEIKKQKGIHYDAECVDVCIALFKDEMRTFF